MTWFAFEMTILDLAAQRVLQTLLFVPFHLGFHCLLSQLIRLIFAQEPVHRRVNHV